MGSPGAHASSIDTVPGEHFLPLGCSLPDCQLPVEHLGKGSVPQSMMGPLVVEEPEARSKLLAGFPGVDAGFQADLASAAQPVSRTCP